MWFGEKYVESHYFRKLYLFQTLGCKPIASLDHFTPDMLGNADLVEEITVGQGKVVKVILFF